MRHLPYAGALPIPPAAVPFLVVKQDNNGDTFVITDTEAPSIAAEADAYTHVEPRRIGAWTHPTTNDLPTYDHLVSHSADSAPHPQDTLVPGWGSQSTR
jgi:hypothetical protein